MKLKLLLIFTLFSCFVYGQADSQRLDSDRESNSRIELEKSPQLTTYKGSFGNAFIQARLELGPDQDFSWEGKMYTTNFTHDHQIPIIYRAIEGLQSELAEKTVALDSLIKFKNASLDLAINKANTQIITLDSLIEEISARADEQYKEVGKTINNRTIYWVFATLILLLVIVLIFYILKSKLNNQDSSLVSVKKTQEKLETETLNLDTKLIQILERKLDHATSNQPTADIIDHSLPIKLGEEIHRMRKRLMSMEESQGTKVLNARIESLESKLNDTGYQIVDLLGRKYDEGMELANAQFIPDPSLKDGERIITRVIMPQIVYEGEIVRPAEVDISQGD